LSASRSERSAPSSLTFVIGQKSIAEQ
jgi:hypothetical protein